MPPAAWSWMPSTDTGMNPVPTPKPLKRGLDVKLSTGPDGEFRRTTRCDETDYSTSNSLAVSYTIQPTGQ